MLKDIFELGESPYDEADAEWDAFVAAHPHGSLLQSSNWARLKSRFNWTSQRVWLRRDNRLVAGAQVMFRGAAFGLIKIGYIPHGPLVDWRDDEQVTVMLNQIDQAAYKNRAGLVKIEPLLWQQQIDEPTWLQICARHGLLPVADTIQPPRTMLIDLRPEPDEILARMKQKTRYNIRLAGRKEVVVRTGGAEDISLFAELMLQTGSRNEFGVHAPSYYKAAYELFAPEHAVMLIAEYTGRPLAAAMVFALGNTAYYLFGGSNDEERNRMPAYAVQWAAIEWARDRGCHYYDLWGVPDQPPAQLEAAFQAQSAGLWGVYRFKRGFAGEIQRTVGAADRVYNKLTYRLYQRRRGLGGA